MHTDSTATAVKFARAAHTNRPDALPGVDGRSKSARRFRDLVSSYSAQLGGELTEGQKVLVREAASLTIQSENLQSDVCAGRLVDLDRLAAVSAALTTVLSTLGLAGR